LRNAAIHYTGLPFLHESIPTQHENRKLIRIPFLSQFYLIKVRPAYNISAPLHGAEPVTFTTDDLVK